MVFFMLFSRKSQKKQSLKYYKLLILKRGFDVFSFIKDKELAKYLDDVFKNEIAKDAFKRFEDLDSRNLTDEYLDKTNSGELEDPMNYKSSGLVYTESKDDIYRVFVLMPGVSKYDISITYVENGDCKHLKVSLNEDVIYEYSMYFNFLKNIDKTWKIDLPSDVSEPKITMDNGVLKIECSYINAKKEIKLNIQ